MRINKSNFCQFKLKLIGICFLCGVLSLPCSCNKDSDDGTDFNEVVLVDPNTVLRVDEVKGDTPEDIVIPAPPGVNTPAPEVDTPPEVAPPTVEIVPVDTPTVESDPVDADTVRFVQIDFNIVAVTFRYYTGITSSDGYNEIEDSVTVINRPEGNNLLQACMYNGTFMYINQDGYLVNCPYYDGPCSGLSVMDGNLTIFNHSAEYMGSVVDGQYLETPNLYGYSGCVTAHEDWVMFGGGYHTDYAHGTLRFEL